MLTVFIPKENQENEQRVAATPESVRSMLKAGLEVTIEPGCGEAAHFADEAYEAEGASPVSSAERGWAEADIVLKVAPPRPRPVDKVHEATLMKEGALLLATLNALDGGEGIELLQRGGVSAIAMELLPRITRAQSMDVLSSQASIAGYKAALLCATHLDKYFPLLMTAAGTIQPAKVVIMGAGVAGLQALATCRRLGAVVYVSDIREAVKEEVASLGGRFIDLPDSKEGEGEGGYAREVSEAFLHEQQARVAEHVKGADAVITTALIPGRPAPKLITEAMIKEMRPGAVVVDMAVARGGNCALSEAGKTVKRHGVTIIGNSQLASTLPADASRLYARNLWALLKTLLQGEGLSFNLEDEILAQALVTHQGSLRGRLAPEDAGEESA